MSKPGNTPDNSPLTKDDQPDKGPIKSEQRNGHGPDGKDLSQGSETSTRGSSRGR